MAERYMSHPASLTKARLADAGVHAASRLLPASVGVIGIGLSAPSFNTFYGALTDYVRKNDPFAFGPG